MSQQSVDLSEPLALTEANDANKRAMTSTGGLFQEWGKEVTWSSVFRSTAGSLLIILFLIDIMAFLIPFVTEDPNFEVVPTILHILAAICLILIFLEVRTLYKKAEENLRELENTL